MSAFVSALLAALGTKTAEAIFDLATERANKARKAARARSRERWAQAAARIDAKIGFT